ncbi:MAG: hypothetical protein HYX65_02105 [Gemmatimonadetes bacterium]|nr:hypothetical protein [Gemmatimonadota bacterium]
MTPTRPKSPVTLHQAFDEARFGARRTLNLRLQLLTPTQAVTRAEAWLRERQVAKAGEVLVITGRGKRSPGGVSAVKTAVVRRLAVLRRRGVVQSVREHSPGSFAVTLAPMSALVNAAPRARHPAEQGAAPHPAVLAGISPAGRTALRTLAVRSLEELGAGSLADRVVLDEMVRLYGRLSGTIEGTSDPDGALRAAVAAVLDELDAR